MRVLGIGYAGTQTVAYEEMIAFARDVLGLTEASEDALRMSFRLPNGDTFSVVRPHEDVADGRTIGFLVDDCAAAVERLRVAGELVGEARSTFAHFRGPDGRMYEVLERP